jgi:hypothetical protein
MPCPGSVLPRWSCAPVRRARCCCSIWRHEYRHDARVALTPETSRSKSCGFRQSRVPEMRLPGLGARALQLQAR